MTRDTFYFLLDHGYIVVHEGHVSLTARGRKKKAELLGRAKR